MPITKVDPDTLAAIRLLRGEGWTIARIARALRLGAATVHRHLGELERLDARIAEYEDALAS